MLTGAILAIIISLPSQPPHGDDLLERLSRRGAVEVSRRRGSRCNLSQQCTRSAVEVSDPHMRHNLAVKAFRIDHRTCMGLGKLL